MRHLKMYRAIRTIHRNGSIRKAADRLATSPSALNRALQAFEDELGVPVFDRVPGGVELTAAGELLVVLTERHLTEFDELQAEMRSLRDGMTGRVAITFGQDIDAGVLLAAVASFETAYPGVSVSVEAAGSLSRLKRRLVDLAVTTNPQTDDAVEVLYSRNVTIGAWIGQGFDHVSGIWDLLDDRLVLPPEGTGTRSAFRHVLRRHRLEERATTTAAASHMADLVVAGHRSCIAPTSAIRPGPPPHGFPRLALTLGDVQVSVLRASGVTMKKAAEALSLCLQTALEEHDA